MPVITVSAVGFIRADGRVLTVRKRGTAAYMLPGGKPEAGETAMDAAIREVDEELAIVVAPGELTLLGEFDAPAANEDGHTVRATVFVANTSVQPQVRAEIDDARWEDPAAPSTDTAPLNSDHVFPLLSARAAR